jgi:hypothetical protein
MAEDEEGAQKSLEVITSRRKNGALQPFRFIYPILWMVLTYEGAK